MLKLLLTSGVLLCVFPLWAQTGLVKGRVVSKETGAPIEDATVFLIGATRMSTFSNQDGAFDFERVPEGRFEVIASRVGFQTEKKEIIVGANQTTEVAFVMSPKGLRVAEIVVTAKEETRGSELGTTSRIERRAIEHVQPFSLADILQLAPGQLAENPNLQSPRQVLLRQVPTNAEGAFMNAFGTAIVLDDAPVSNNANLQSDVTILNSPPTAQPPFSSVVGRGVDLRQIATNNIESVEIIRGIPSARHGDLTAGAILVQTRASAFPLQTRARLNPNIFEIAVGQGFEFRNQKTALAFDLNYSNRLTTRAALKSSLIASRDSSHGRSDGQARSIPTCAYRFSQPSTSGNAIPKTRNSSASNFPVSAAFATTATSFGSSAKCRRQKLSSFQA